MISRSKFFYFVLKIFLNCLFHCDYQRPLPKLFKLWLITLCISYLLASSRSYSIDTSMMIVIISYLLASSRSYSIDTSMMAASIVLQALVHVDAGVGECIQHEALTATTLVWTYENFNFNQLYKYVLCFYLNWYLFTSLDINLPRISWPIWLKF